MQHTRETKRRDTHTATVLIVDDHEMVREGLLTLLSGLDEFTVVGGVASIAEAIEFAGSNPPDVAVVDILLSDGKGTEIIRYCKENHATCKVIALSMYSSAEYVHDAFAAGADAYVSKASASRSLIEAMYAVRRGELYADAVSTRALLESVGWLRQDGVSDQRYASLSQREREVFFLIAKGRTTKEIARRLDVSTKTVETHRASIYAKLDVSSPVAIARYAAQLGLV